MESMCEREKENSLKKEIYGHFSQNSSKLKAYILKVADGYFFLFYIDNFFSLSHR